MSSSMSPDAPEAISLTTDIVSAYVSANKVKVEELTGLLQSVHDAVCALAAGGVACCGGQAPAVPISKSVTNDHVVCLEDGKKLKMLKRYLRTHYGMSPEDYRRKWGLPADYPMTAPSCAAKRSQFAKGIGLGRVRGATKKEARKSTKAKSGVRKRAKRA